MKKRILCLLLTVVMLVTLLPQVTLKAKAHSIVMTAEEFVDCLWTAYSRPNYYYNSFPYNLGYYDGSRISFDCWNLGKAIIWTKGAIVNNYTVGKYAAMDTSCGLGDWGGYEIITQAPNCSSNFSNLVPGEWLYMENHVGYYVGDGQVIECTAGWNVWAITVSQIDSRGNRSRNGVPNGSWKLRGMVPWLDYNSSNDKEPPVISNVSYSNVSAAGYTISCTVKDNGSIKGVAFPTWTVRNGQDDLPANFMSTQLGTKSGDTYTFRVNASAHNNETGPYITHIYAEDRGGNVTSLPLSAVDVRNDNQKPVISNVTVSDVSAKGYTVTCTVTDDWGVNSVAFPSWSLNNGQDDLPDYFMTTQLGTKNGNQYTFRVNTATHNNETGAYLTHIYATDCAGNQVCVSTEIIQVVTDNQRPVISDVSIFDISAQGYTVSCRVTDNAGVNKVAFPSWTTLNGQDDMDNDFMLNQLGTRNGDTFTYRMNISDHNYEKGYYVTHIYALDFAGNQTCVELDPILIQDPVTKIEMIEHSDYFMMDGFVLDVKPETDVRGLLERFSNENLQVQDKNGTVITGYTAVGTGATINLYKGSQVVDCVTVVIAGDMDGNSLVDTTDYLRIKSAFIGTFNLSDAEGYAADVDKNDILDATDYMRVKSHFLGTYNLNQ